MGDELRNLYSRDEQLYRPLSGLSTPSMAVSGVVGVTDSESLEFLARASEDLNSSLRVYLEETADCVPDSTYQSHKCQLTAFRDWYDGESRRQPCRPENLVARFLRNLCSEKGRSRTTIRGWVSTLANFLAYEYQIDPEILTVRIGTTLCHECDPRLRTIGERIVSEVEYESASRSIPCIPRCITDLRRRRFGSRTHVYVEVLLDTKSRPEQVRQIDLDDLDEDSGHVTVGIPETHVVSSVGLLTERVAPISATTLDALETHLEYEREEPTTSRDRKPLFTTHDGRASAATLRRSVKLATTDSASASTDESRPVVPDDLWHYAMSTILQRP